MVEDADSLDQLEASIEDTENVLNEEIVDLVNSVLSELNSINANLESFVALEIEIASDAAFRSSREVRLAAEKALNFIRSWLGSFPENFEGDALQVINTAKSFIANAKQALGEVVSAITGFVSRRFDTALLNIQSQFFNQVAPVLNKLLAIEGIFEGDFNGLMEIITGLLSTVEEIFAGLVREIVDALIQIPANVLQFFEWLGTVKVPNLDVFLDAYVKGLTKFSTVGEKLKGV